MNDKIDALLQAADLFPRMLGSVAWLGGNKREQAIAANQLVQQATGLDFMALAGNPHLRLNQNLGLFDEGPTGTPLLAKMVKHLHKSARYKENLTREPGIMPHTLLLRLMRLTSGAFARLIEEALRQGVIKKVSGQPYNYNGCIYAITSEGAAA